MNNFLTIAIGFLLFSSILFGCKKEEIIMATSMSLTPETINLNEGSDASLFVTPMPGGIAQWEVADKPSWLEMTPSSGTLNGKMTEIRLSAAPAAANLQPGIYSGEIELMSATAGFASVTVNLTVDAHPVAELNSEKLEFSTDQDSLTFVLKNSGTGSLNWEIQNNQQWMAVSKESGSLSASGTQEIKVKVSRNGLPVGTEDASLTITSNADNGDIVLPVSMIVPELAYIGVSEEEVVINYFVENKEITITNEGNVNYNWTIQSDQTYITVQPTSGSLNMGESQVITISAQRGELQTGDFNANLTIENNKGENVQVPATLKNYKEEKWLIDAEIKDAEYDRNNDVIIAVSTDMKLLKLDPVNQSSSEVALSKYPKCISLSPDGNFAAVGHDAMISYVDLTSMTVVKTLDVSADVFDIVLASNGYIYAIPASGQWEKIRCINISDGMETLSTGTESIYAGTKIKLHPSGDYIYGANNGISPSDFEKYDISSGTAAYLYDSPYHGDYSFAGNMWISQDGSRLFSRGKNVFKSSTDISLDMYYAGSFEGEGRVVTLDHSTSADKLIAVLSKADDFEIPSSNIRIYDGTYYTFQTFVNFPKFMIPDGFGGGTMYESEGHFAFFNATGSKYYLLVRNTFNNTDFAVCAFEL